MYAVNTLPLRLLLLSESNSSGKLYYIIILSWITLMIISACIFNKAFITSQSVAYLITVSIQWFPAGICDRMSIRLMTHQ